MATKLVEKVLFHCKEDDVLPAVLNEPVDHQPKRRWLARTCSRAAYEMADEEEKSVFAFKNESIPAEISAVVARYSYNDTYDAHVQSRLSLTCSFIMNPGENVDGDDFTRKHL
ncbi:hypothetical protein AAVH_31671 [Aphelenchoides avenae]|nr:hypothetical protein AAVH_31671 [Aphelenchus avenae]